MRDKFNNQVGPQVRSKRPGSGKLIPVLVVLSMVGGLQAATQYFAHYFNYQSALGWNIQKIYAPWAIVQWAATWGRLRKRKIKYAKPLEGVSPLLERIHTAGQTPLFRASGRAELPRFQNSQHC